MIKRSLMSWCAALVLLIAAPGLYATDIETGKAGIGIGTILENQGLTEFPTVTVTTVSPSQDSTTAAAIFQPSAVMLLSNLVGVYDLESCTVFFNTGVVNTCSQLGNFTGDMAISPNSTSWQRFAFSGLEPIVGSGIFSLNNNTMTLQNDLVAETSVAKLSCDGDNLVTETTAPTFTEVDTWRLVAGVSTPCPTSDNSIDLSGTVTTEDGTLLCAMVLASGQYMFSCNPVGVFSLEDLPRESNGTVTRQVYAAGFLPEIDVLQDSINETVVMTRSGTCPNYNTPYDPGVWPGSAGNRIDISGSVLLQNTQIPICAMVLANGQNTFSCDGSGSYSLNIPLDTNGQFKLQVYAAGYAPMIHTFDEFQPINDVRMTPAAECQ